MQIHLSDISSSEGMRIQKTVEFGMDTITVRKFSGACKRAGRAYYYEYR